MPTQNQKALYEKCVSYVGMFDIEQGNMLTLEAAPRLKVCCTA